MLKILTLCRWRYTNGNMPGEYVGNHERTTDAASPSELDPSAVVARAVEVARAESRDMKEPFDEGSALRAARAAVRIVQGGMARVR